MPRHHLSKSRFLAGLQCHRQLWWRVHERRAPELRPSAKLQAILDMGSRVGNRARREFLGAVRINADYLRSADAVEETKQALERGAPAILEASFFEDHILVAVDALTKQAHAPSTERDKWVLTEVKATTRPKPHHVPDAAIQAHVVERAGLPIARVELMHFNTAHRHPDEGPLFLRADITEAVAELRPRIPDQIDAQLQMLEGPLPDVKPGPHCISPRVCPFVARCHVPLPEHAIEELNGIGEKQLADLRGVGIETVDQIPSDFPLKPLHARHRAAVRANEMVVEPGLRDALRRYAFPIAMLDFETVGPALPVWNGCSPFGKVPVQLSVHTLHANSEVTHRAYLAEARGDPRPRVAAEVAHALRDAATILAWNASFEKRCLQMLADSCPEHAQALRQACDQVEDLLVVVRNHLYHPAFRGSFSLKTVAAALLPDLTYDGLEVTDGETASWELERLLCRPEELGTDERNALRAQLEAYCKRDTEVMVALFQLLRKMNE
jgi:predicted RecB family nuclease